MVAPEVQQMFKKAFQRRRSERGGVGVPSGVR
jgi:hypothetical protein